MKKVKVTLKRDELLYDINSITFFTGRSRRSGDNDEWVADMQSGEEEADLVGRFMQNAAESLRPLLSSVLKQDPSVNEADETVAALRTDDFVFELELNDNFDLNQSAAVSTAMHEYIVNRTVSDWFGIANPNEMKIYFDRAELSADKIRRALHRRIKPVRRIPRP